jgi:hypothetical protein
MTLLMGTQPQGGTHSRLPTPYPDELLYSVIARSAYRNAHWSPKGLMGAVFGARAVLACPDLPSRLGLLNGTAGEQWQLSASEIALRYTLVGYYTHYLGVSEREKYLRLMAEKSAHLHLRLGICSAGVRAPSKFFLCPVCTELDIRQHGETYWRRSHQLPGVLVCPVHAVSLIETAVPLRPIGRHEHLHARGQYLAQGVAVLTSPAAALMEVLALARAAASLLDTEVCEGGPLHDYREQLHARGFKGTSGVDGLWFCLRKLLGDEVIEKLFRGAAGTSAPSWLWELFRKPRRPLHPLKHLLIARIICAHEVRISTPAPLPVKTWRVFRNPDLRRQAHELAKKGLTTNAVATRLRVDWRTAHRLLQPLPVALDRISHFSKLSDRKAWCSIAKKHPGCGRTQLRRQEPALYARLYRGDREWLLQHGERLPKKPGRPRVSWPVRDEALSKSVQALANQIKHAAPMRRASASHVLGILSARTTVNRNGDRLPLTISAIAAHCESVEDFQVRRVLAEQETDGWFPRPTGHVLRAARLNPARFPDKGLGILARANQLREERNARPPVQDT